ncbi:MAG: helix-turn-helix transcriptional regulator [Ruminococcaceae bacterium]|nr:helix-turn-helix transcriptional regulator [Oscillospiraceae bacterium]
MNNLRTIFGKNLKKHRKEKGLSQEGLAELCGLHRTYISDVECFRRNISLDNIEKISNALNMKACVLLIEDGSKNGLLLLEDLNESND